MKQFTFVCLAFSLLCSCLVARAQPFELSWFTIDGGGGTSSGGPYSLSGTIGQSDAGAMAGGSFTLVSGFWSVIAAVPTPGSPHLSITLAEPNVILSWPASAPGFVLQENTDLMTSLWTDVPAPVRVVGDTNEVTVPIAIGNRFYRLIK